MLRLFVGRCNRQANVSSVQLSSLFSTKGSSGNDGKVGEHLEVKPEHPMDRAWKCVKRDMTLLQNKIWKTENKTAANENKKKGYDDPDGAIFPGHCDILIVGGGAIGSSAAYWCKKMLRGSLRVVVVERDPTYRQCSSVLSAGGLRQQFSLEENIEMSLFGAEFLRNVNDYLGIEGEPMVDCQFHPDGYLCLGTEKSVDILKQNHELQKALGAKNVLLTKNQLKAKFPWINPEGVEIACLGLENEGWFDPWLLLSALKRKAMSMGVEYVTGTAKGFAFKQAGDEHYPEEKDEDKQLDYLVVETEDGKQRSITFSKCVVAAGAFSAEIARMARIGVGDGILQVPLPVEPRKRYVFVVHAPDGPGLNTPLTIDPTGVYFRREGLANNYVCGLSPRELEDEPPTDNLDVDQEWFNNRVWPVLANRVPAFENLKVKSSWAGYYDFNTVDENAIIGPHPHYSNLIFATGFSGHGIQKAPAVGRAVSEVIIENGYRTIDLSRLSFERFITSKAIKENNVW